MNKSKNLGNGFYGPRASIIRRYWGSILLFIFAFGGGFIAGCGYQQPSQKVTKYEMLRANWPVVDLQRPPGQYAIDISSTEEERQKWILEQGYVPGESLKKAEEALFKLESRLKAIEAAERIAAEERMAAAAEKEAKAAAEAEKEAKAAAAAEKEAVARTGEPRVILASLREEESVDGEFHLPPTQIIIPEPPKGPGINLTPQVEPTPENVE
jgi:hypothetical protein